MRYAFITSCITAILVSPGHGMAAAVTNLDHTTHKIILVEGDGNKSIEIKAGDTFRLVGRIKLIYRDREIVIDSDEEYAIWKDGTIGPQRHIKRNSKGLQ